MPRTRFTPDDPVGVHARFERVRERALRRMEEELKLIKRARRMDKPAPRRMAPRSGRTA
jgi:hypothetical protein